MINLEKMNLTAEARKNLIAFYPGAVFGADAVKTQAYDAKTGGLRAAVDNNNLGQTSTTLWQGVAQRAIDAVTKKYADMRRFSYNIDTAEIPTPPGVVPHTYIEVVDGAGDAIDNATDWNKSDLTNHYEKVDLNRVSRPFGLSSYDLQNGERIETKLTAAIESVVARCFGKHLTDAINAALPADISATVAPAAGKAGVQIVDAATFTPSFVAHTLSALFGDYGQVDNLIVKPTFKAPLVPDNALALGYADGVYDIGHIEGTAGLNGLAPVTDAETSTTTYHGAGFAARKQAIGFGARVPQLDMLSGVISFLQLGSVNGIPLMLKSWVEPGKEIIYNSVETMVGFKVLDPKSLYVLATA